jgi:cholesterol transport system auxiliary component
MIFPLRIRSFFRTAHYLVIAALISACATPVAPLAVHDLGPLPATSTATATTPLPSFALGDVTASAFLDNPGMFYRLAYADAQQPHAYAASRWSMPPAQLFEQRLKARFGQAGNPLVSVTDGALNVPLLHCELDEFSQVFDQPGSSKVTVTVRAAVFQNRQLVAQKSFTQQRPAASADAAGGARALAGASDAVIDDITTWLRSVPRDHR